MKTACVSPRTHRRLLRDFEERINGVYHHVGKQHLHRYLSEFDFRYNSRKEKDGKFAH